MGNWTAFFPNAIKLYLLGSLPGHVAHWACAGVLLATPTRRRPRCFICHTPNGHRVALRGRWVSNFTSVVLIYESKLTWKGFLTLWNNFKKLYWDQQRDLRVRAIKHPIITIEIEGNQECWLKSQEEEAESNMLLNLAFMHLSGQLKLKLAFAVLFLKTDPHFN